MQDKKSDPGFLISLLQNSFHYGLQSVFIKVYKDRFQLIVIHNNRLLYDRTYPTMRGAKIAFTKLYQNQWYGTEKCKTAWTDPYDPGAEWLEPKIEIVEKGGAE